MNFLQSLSPFLPPGKSLLKRNGFDNVTILTTYQDYKMASKAIAFMDIFQKRVCAGQTLSEAMYSAEQTFPDAANFLRHTAREIGQLKGQRNELENIAEFDEPDSLTPEEEKIEEKKKRIKIHPPGKKLWPRLEQKNQIIFLLSSFLL